MMQMKHKDNTFLSTNQLANYYLLGSYRVPRRCEAPSVDGNNYVSNSCGINWLQTKHVSSRGSPGWQRRMNGKLQPMDADYFSKFKVYQFKNKIKTNESICDRYYCLDFIGDKIKLK